MPYTPVHADWRDANSATGGGDTTTPIAAADLEHIETGISTATTGAETAITNVSNHLADTSDAHDASAISVADTGDNYSGSDVEEVLAEIAQAADSTPVGVIASFAGSASPDGWLICSGATASTVTYPNLAAVLGTTYGATGSGFFTLPDFRGRISVGLGTALAVSALGNTDGVAVGNRRPQHKHTAHNHTVAEGLAGAGSQITLTRATTTDASQQTVNTSSVDGGSGVSTDSLDSPAYIVVNYIIKT